MNADAEISDVGGEVLGNNMFSYCLSNPVNMSDPTGHWPEWGAKLLNVAIVAAAVITATVCVVSTFGVASVAGIAMISASVTFAVRTTEVIALQTKKSKKENCSDTETIQNCVESVYDNGDKILGATPFTKTGATIAMGKVQNKISEILHHTSITQCNFLGSSGGKIFPVIGVGVAVYNATISIFSENPTDRATERGLSLK